MTYIFGFPSGFFPSAFVSIKVLPKHSSNDSKQESYPLKVAKSIAGYAAYDLAKVSSDLFVSRQAN